MKVILIAPALNRGKGAEQQDILGFIELLRQFEEIDFTVMFINQVTRKIENQDLEKLRVGTKLNSWEFIRVILTYLMLKLLCPDRGMMRTFTLGNVCSVIKTGLTRQFDAIITLNSNTLVWGFLFKGRHIHRSHNFEPLHFLTESPRKSGKVLIFCTKLIGAFLEKRVDFLMPISHRDARWYQKVPLATQAEVLPLTYLAAMKVEKLVLQNEIELGFTGSTYNVEHNRKSLEFILNTFEDALPPGVQLNIYGEKLPNRLLRRMSKEIRFQGWSKSKAKLYERNHVFLAPYFGGMGMQSKVFEPLINGRILVADPEALADYPFKAWYHFIPAVSSEDFLVALDWIMRNRGEALAIACLGRLKSLELFNNRNYLGTLSRALDNQSLNSP